MRRHGWLIAVLAVTSFPGVTTVDASSLSQHAPPFTGQELQRFVDRVLPKDMAATHVPGAVFVAVKGGQILSARGYGYSNLAHKARVSPHTTVFHLGPTSVVFTAAAVLKLAQEGNVALRANVNRYLTAFKLASTFRRPVTLADLLTNTGGFGDRHIGRMTYSAPDVRPLGQYLATSMPPRLVPPGEEYSYSTYGFALAGYVVQAVSRVSFARYVDQHLFRPLGMNHSTFQPVSASVGKDIATGYDVGPDGIPHAAPDDYFNVAPAEGMAASGIDIGHFLIALLQNGRYRGNDVLRPETVRDMERQDFSSYPRIAGYPPMPGVAYGFDRYEQNGQLLIEQSGAARGFTSLIALLPALHVGFFIAGNTAHDTYMFNLQRQILDHFFPATSSPARHPAFESQRPSLDRFAGSYWSDEYAPSTIEKLRQLVNQITISATGTDALIAHFWDGRVVHLTRVSNLLFQTGAGINASYWAFHTDSDGRVRWMAAGGNEVYDKIAWYETTDVQLVFLAAIVLVFLSGLLLWLLVPLSRRALSRRREEGILFGSRGSGAALAAWLVGVSSLLNLFFLVAIALAMVSAISTQDEHYSWLEYGVPLWVTALLTVPLLTTVLVAGLVAFTAIVWKRSYWSMARRLHYTLTTLASLAFIPFLLFWNLLGYHY